MARAWILQANPDVWDVWTWWEEQAEDLDSWTIARHVHDVQIGDDFALWISGAKAGVYAIGSIVDPPDGPVQPDGSYWVHPPQHTVWSIGLRVTRYLFDDPLLKENLRQDPDFARALILRMPGSANPIPLGAVEWRAIARGVGRRGQAGKPTSDAPIVTARPLGDTPEDITVPTLAQEQKRSFREARLIKRYEKFIGRPLTLRSIRLPTGERLVCDAFDAGPNVLIEAKSSPSRQDVRMAIGQLLDYRRHLVKGATLAVLLPARPADDVVDLLSGLGITLLVENGKGFVTI